MSTDVYIDFHSPKSWELYSSGQGTLYDLEDWHAYLRKKEGAYQPCRIGYAYNFLPNDQEVCALFKALEEDYNGTEVTRKSIQSFLATYRALYQTVRKNQESDPVYDAEESMYPVDPDDILEPEELERILNDYVSTHTRMRFGRID